MRDCTWEELEEQIHTIELQEEALQAANIVLFGARLHGDFAYECLSRTYHIAAFTDNNSVLWGKTFKGIRVIEPDALKQIDNLLVIITVTSHHYSTIKTQLDSAGVRYITYAEYVVAKYFKEFKTVHDQLLEDPFSQKTYRNILMSHLTHDTELLKDVFVRDQYFAIPEFTVPSEKEVFVDCGAYVGDVMERYLFQKTGLFKHMYLFEPTEHTCQALKHRRERLVREWALEEGQITIENKAISSEDNHITFLKEGNISNRIIGGGQQEACVQIATVSLDSYFEKVKDMPTFIKADIEGFELELVKGSQQIIRGYKPLIAICVYHKTEDLFELPLKLKQLNPDYKMAIRHHMPNYHETVLYCY